MRLPASKYKLCTYGLPEIRRAFEDELLDVRGRDVQITDEILTRGHLIHACVLWVLTRPKGERALCIDRGLAEYKLRLESDEPIPIVADGLAGEDLPIEPEATRPKGASAIEMPAKKRQPKRKHSPRRRAEKGDRPA